MTARAFLRATTLGLLLPALLAAQEREVVIYVSHDDVYSRPILEAYEKASGVRVNAVYDTEASKTVGLVNRILSEAARPRADVFWNNEAGQTLRLKTKGLLQPYVSPAAAAIPAAMKDPEGHWTGFAARARVLIYNKDLIDEASLPRRMEDLVLPRFKGKLAMARPKTGTTLTHAGALFAAWGPERAFRYFDQLLGQDVRWESGNGQVARTVAEGGRPFGLTDTDDANGMRLDGYPVATAFLDQEPGGLGNLVIPNTVMILAGAPHLDEAKQLVDQLLAPAVEAELAAGRAAQIPLHPGVATPPGVASLDRIAPMGVDFAVVGRMIEEHAAALADRFETRVDATGKASLSWTLILALVALAAVLGGIAFGMSRGRGAGS